jgi:hypothetical protein
VQLVIKRSPSAGKVQSILTQLIQYPITFGLLLNSHFHIASQPLLNPNYSLPSPTSKMKTSFSTLLFAFSLTGRYVLHLTRPPLPFSTTTNSNPNRVLADLHQNAVCVDTMDAGVKPLPSQTYSIPLTTLRMSSTKQQQPQLAATTS